MSWFGDSLNSLKGQITKITKEVLAEDGKENEEPSSVQLSSKEFEELCAAKDLEINSLREENVRISESFQEEIKLLRNENKILKTAYKKTDEGNSLFSDDQIREICELENQLQQLQTERDHLEELQKDHQSNICLVVKQRDNYKQELEKLKENYSNLQMKFEELLCSKDDEKGGNSLSDINLTEDEVKQDELVSLEDTIGMMQAQVESFQNDKDEMAKLKDTIETMQAKLESFQNEKDEMAKLIEEYKLNFENFKEKTKKLAEEKQILGKEKKTIEEENEKLNHKINSMTMNLNMKIGELKVEQRTREEIEEKLKAMTQTVESVKAERADFQKNLERQVRRLAYIFFDDGCDVRYTKISIPVLIAEIEKQWKKVLGQKESSEMINAETVKQLKNDIMNLKVFKCELERALKTEMDKKNELECNYKKEINLLRSKCARSGPEEEGDEDKSYTDDVKRLTLEVSKLLEEVKDKDEELRDCFMEMNEMSDELSTLRSMTVKADHDIFKLSCENEGYEKSMMDVKIMLENKDRLIRETSSSLEAFQERCTTLEQEKEALLKKNSSLTDRLNDSKYKVFYLERDIKTLKTDAEKVPLLERELQGLFASNVELEEISQGMRTKIANRCRERENLKERLIERESTISEQDEKIQNLTRELNQSKEDILKLQAVEEELNKYKQTMTEIEKQRQEERQLIKNECASQKSQVTNTGGNDVEMARLTRENKYLKEVCSKLEMEVKDKTQKDASKVENENINEGNAEISSLQSENYSLRTYVQQQTNIIRTLTYENKELKHKLQLANEKVNKWIVEMEQLREEKERKNDQDTNSDPNIQGKKNGLQGGSDADAAEDVDPKALELEIKKLKEISQRQADEYKALQELFNLIIDKEAHSKKELERLKVHLIETENYYMETIDEYKAKLSAAEEQLKNSSSLYTSNKVRDNQHLESLQSQIRLMSVQRDSLQEQLSTAQDEIQRQKAALVSLHVVLQQFQQDKDRECQNLAVKYQNQLAEHDKRFAKLQQEKEYLDVQLLDAKNGLNAASRLGEQLEKKNEYIADLEEKVAKMEVDVKEYEEAAKLMNQSDAEKVDKSLLKNLLLGYISSQKADRKEQVLRIMMSVLDFDEEEKSKAGIDNTQPGWLSSLLHPKGDGESSSQSLSEAFIRFLENESRPQPQLKLLPEHTSNADKSKSSSATPKPSLLLEELVLPTFTSPQSSESSILKDVLEDPKSDKM